LIQGQIANHSTFAIVLAWTVKAAARVRVFTFVTVIVFVCIARASKRAHKVLAFRAVFAQVAAIQRTLIDVKLTIGARVTRLAFTTKSNRIHVHTSRIRLTWVLDQAVVDFQFAVLTGPSDGTLAFVGQRHMFVVRVAVYAQTIVFALVGLVTRIVNVYVAPSARVAWTARTQIGRLVQANALGVFRAHAFRTRIIQFASEMNGN
jgi:hypothetical protein